MAGPDCTGAAAGVAGTGFRAGGRAAEALFRSKKNPPTRNALSVGGRSAHQRMSEWQRAGVGAVISLAFRSQKATGPAAICHMSTERALADRQFDLARLRSLQCTRGNALQEVVGARKTRVQLPDRAFVVFEPRRCLTRKSRHGIPPDVGSNQDLPGERQHIGRETRTGAERSVPEAGACALAVKQYRR